jgi:hypothetical protein
MNKIGDLAENALKMQHIINFGINFNDTGHDGCSQLYLD